MIESVCERYQGRTGKSYGRFENDIDNYPMQTIVRDYVQKRDSFYECSRRMMNHLKERADAERLSTGGFVFLSHLGIDGKEYLLVAIVNEATGSVVNEDLEILDSKYLDIDKLRVAGRIDLTSWKEQIPDVRYVSFLRGHADISDYFKKFLGCSIVSAELKDTQMLVKALKKFAQELDPCDRDAFFDRAYDKLKQLRKDNIPLDLNSFANELSPDNPDILKQKFTAEEFELSDGFIPDTRAIQTLKIFKGKSTRCGKWEIKFDREALNESVIFDQDYERLILYNIPSDLKEQLLEEDGQRSIPV